jgi:sulfate/thiosulfate transport system permease protein
MQAFAIRRSSPLPGFGLTLGIIVFYLGLVVLVPLAGLILSTTRMELSEFVAKALTSPRVPVASHFAPVPPTARNGPRPGDRRFT